MTSLFLVIKCGVYRHDEVIGAYDSETKAIEAAAKATELEEDHYHQFEIQPIELNQAPIIEDYYLKHYDNYGRKLEVPLKSPNYKELDTIEWRTK